MSATLAEPAVTESTPASTQSSAPAKSRRVNNMGWFEVPVTDLARATRFYEAAFAVQLLTDPRSLRDGYLEALEEYLVEVRRGCARKGIDYQLIKTSDYLDAILAAVSDGIASTDDALTGLVRRVLLAALELREGRRRHEEDHRAT